MNAPLPDAVRKALETVTLDDKYTLHRGAAFMSGVQALVRLPLLQRVRDAATGLNTAGFISGYRGSPLGGYDQALWQARAHLQGQNIVFQPGVNEELAATAIWGTQLLDLFPQKKKFDGVFGIWYGKGPGVDRCGDVFKHANMAGSARHGGVIAVAGDDHVAKSSTAAHQSDHIFKACGLPVFFPSSVQEILDLGLHAFAMSRFAGVWTGMKTIQEVVESSASVEVDPDRVRIVLPEDFAMPAGGVHVRWPDHALEQEARLFDFKWYAALAYVRANGLNHDVLRSAHDRLGLIGSGKAYNDMRQALHDLGLDEAECARLGIRVHKVAVVWPLEATIARRFAQGLQEILVVEEKRQLIEYQLKEELYNWRDDVRPNVLGKFDEAEGDASGGEWSRPNPSANTLLRAKADLNPALIARAIARRLQRLGVDADTARRLDASLAAIDARAQALAQLPASSERTPWFCSGCPHNTSTRVPEGSRAAAGIGCHFMATWMDRRTIGFSQMGGEGVSWVGQAPFTTESHIFANLGDGTYFHSGVLAVRQAIAAGVNITYKILFNDAVAMTGGQPVDGTLRVPEMTRELDAEGARRIVVVTDEPDKYAPVMGRLAPGVQVRPRDALDAVQRELRTVPGCSVLIYDQTCATEKRRRRKRGTLATPARTVLINPRVCEGCGDCSVHSNCLSVEPLETEFGRKRQINQSSCNKDFSCVQGFCPSFVTIEGGTRKAPRRQRRGDLAAMPALPEPPLPPCDEAYGILVAGVGGTGVITIGQLLGMAAHLEGKGVVTQDAGGLAQKGGAAWSHVQIANRPEALFTSKVEAGQADLLLACDAIVAATRPTLQALARGRSFVALNNHGTPTAALIGNPQWQFPGARCAELLGATVGPQQLAAVDAENAALLLLGESIYTNPLLLGYAWQLGRIPLSRAALRRAMELNGVQVQGNQDAFEWGRHCAHDPAAMQALLAPPPPAAGATAAPADALPALVARRAEELRAYQDAAYAARYQAFVGQVGAAEAALGTGRALSTAVAHNLFKLMAYKDEYEVARLHRDPAFLAQIESMFDGDYRIVHHLAPPLVARRNARGELVKQPYGPWVRTLFALLAKMKGLRGGALDLFGRSAERRSERALIEEYRQSIEELLQGLSAERLPLALEIANIPEQIRGFGHVKERHLQAARAQWAQLRAQWRAR